MLKLYPLFYRERGVRRPTELYHPKLVPFTEFPKNAVYHHLSYDDVVDLDPTLPYFDISNRRVALDFVDRLSGNLLGHPRLIPNRYRERVLKWCTKHQEFRYVHDAAKTVLEDNRLVVINYNYLKEAYRYPEHPLSEMYRWQNLTHTLWGNIKALLETTSKHHFVILPPIEELPSYSQLTQFGSKAGMSYFRVFNTPEKQVVSNFFTYLTHSEATTGSFGEIADEDRLRVSVVFQTPDGNASVMNLGYLTSWLKDHKNLTDVSSVSQYPGQMLGKMFLGYLLNLSAHAPETPAEEADSEEASDPEEDPEITDDPDLEDEEEEEERTGHRGISKKGQNDFQEAPKNFLKNVSDLDEDSFGGSEDSLAEELDKSLEILERQAANKLVSRGYAMQRDDVVETQEIIVPPSQEDLNEQLQMAKRPNDRIKATIKRRVDTGIFSPQEYKAAAKDVEAYGNMTDPYGSGQLVSEMVQSKPGEMMFDPEKTQLQDSPAVFDKSMLGSSLNSYTSDYVEKYMKRDVLRMVGAVQSGGVALRKHEVDVEWSALGGVELHRLELKPLDGAASSIWIKIPVVNEDGTYMANGNKYHMRKQRVDLPIRKISPTQVGLSSYYGKSFVSTATKRANSTMGWVIAQINKASLSGSDWITGVVPGDSFNSYREAPYVYSALSTEYRSLKAGPWTLYFDNREPHLEIPAVILNKGMTWCGEQIDPSTSRSASLFVDMNDQFFSYEEGILTPVGSVYDLLRLDAHDAPVQYSELQIFRKAIPVALVLGFKLGFPALLSLLNPTYRKVEPKKNVGLTKDEYAIPFKDGTYVFTKKERLATMVLAGFMEYAKVTRQYDVREFANPDVYLNLISSKGLSVIYIREMEMMLDYFIDPITEDILREMKEPTTFEGLLIRASEMLLTYSHPKSQDTAYTRTRGYERIPGMVYKELTMAIRTHRSRNLSGRGKIAMSPWKVWQSISEDPSKKMFDEINPVQDLKADESITYVGEGGRSKDAINKASRAYHANDIGIVSEATVDSGDVGVNNYLSANPAFQDMFGMKGDTSDVNTTNLLSTSALLAPGVMHDDMKRVVFVSIQQGHTIMTEGYHPPYVRTGYEGLMAQRTSSIFAYCAKADGKVVSVNDKGVIVEYADGRRVGVPIGKLLGRSEGAIYPHHVVTDLKVGDTVKKGDPISYNTGFFEKDPLNPGGLVMKNSLNARVALMELKQTHEDSSSISRKLSDRLRTRVVYLRNFTVEFGQALHNVVKPGQKVKPSDILMSIEDEITSSLGAFDAQSLEVLKGLAKQSPKANYLGIIDRVEVFYHGDKEEMTPSLRALAEASDRVIVSRAKSINQPAYTGKVTDDYRVDGTPLGFGKAEIRFYIQVSTAMGVADKVVFANQMKSVNSEVMDYTVYTESGEEIDAIFGNRSIAARNVMSPYIIGTTATLLRLFAEEAVREFKGTPK